MQPNVENKKVLFIDDEKMVLEVGSLMLDKLGYTAFTSTNCHTAIEILKENKVAFVILDLRMPDMNSVDIYHLLKNIQPNIKVLITSGYFGNRSEEELSSIGFDGFLQKPFNFKQLSGKIKNMLEN